MRTILIMFFFFYAVILISGCSFSTSNAVTQNAIQTSTVANLLNENNKNVDSRRNSKTVINTSWNAAEQLNLNCTVELLTDTSNEEKSIFKVSKHDSEIMFLEDFERVSSVYNSYVMRKAHPQLIVNGFQNGSEVIKIFDIESNKVKKLFDSTDFGVNPLSIEIRPQFRSNINSAVEPYQVLIADGVGLANRTVKSVKIYRYKNGKYVQIGQIDANRIDDFIETNLLSK